MTFTIKIGEGEYLASLLYVAKNAYAFFVGSEDKKNQVAEHFKSTLAPTPTWAEEVTKTSEVKTFLEKFATDPANAKLFECEQRFYKRESITSEMMLLAYLHWLEHCELRDRNSQVIYDIALDYVESYPDLADRVNIKSRLIAIATQKIEQDVDRAIAEGQKSVEDALL